LIGRKFVHGASDCYTLIRAYYWQIHGIMLPDFARDDNWWKEGENIYADQFAAAGFRQISADEVKEGDVFIGKVRSAVPNHGGILLSNGIGLHHLADRLSRRESILPWRRFVTHWLRYENLSNGDA
jgi:cell wall-associated NlpC family hydrolase